MLEALSRAAFARDVDRLDARTVAHRGWTIVTADYPVLDVIFGHPSAAPLRVRFDCTGWDDQPPSITLLDAAGGYLMHAPPNVGSIFNGSPHPDTGRPFVCMRGAREFHTHPSHLSEHWENYRGQSGNDLLGLLAQLWRAWKGAVR